MPATKKKPSKKKATEPEPEPKITLDTVKTLVLRALEDPTRGVPALIGPPQWGKTHYVLEWLKEIGCSNVVSVNPQTDLPEDVAGWPVREGKKLDFTQPSIIPHDTLKKKNWGIFIDELDKSRDDTLSSMLTLLNPGERRLRRTHIAPEIPIVVAMNEPRRQLPEPLIARLLFVPFPPEGFAARDSIGYLGGNLTPPPVEIPQRPHAPGSYFKLKAWLGVEEFATDKSLRKAVVSGLFPANQVPAVLELLTPKEVNYGLEWAKVATPREVLVGLYSAISNIHFKKGNEILATLKERAQGEKDGEMERVLAHTLYNSENFECVGREKDPAKLKEIGEKAAAEYAKSEAAENKE